MSNAQSRIASPSLNAMSALTENEKKKTLDKLNSKVTFPGIFNGVDLEYDVKSDSMKENFVLDNKDALTSVTFKLSMSNLTPELQKDNTIHFFDIGNPSKKVFEIQAPVMFDAREQSSKDIQVTLKKIDNEYSMTLTPGKAWLSDPERVYPVKIDPDVTVPDNDVMDAHVAENLPDYN